MQGACIHGHSSSVGASLMFGASTVAFASTYGLSSSFKSNQSLPYLCIQGRECRCCNVQLRKKKLSSNALITMRCRVIDRHG